MMLWDHSEPFPPDPNAPRSRPDRPKRLLGLAAEASEWAAPDALERDLAQVHLIGPAAGGELRRIVYGHRAGHTASGELRDDARVDREDRATRGPDREA